MNATDLNAMTVKALNTVARDLKMKRYSALRKAALVAAIIEFNRAAEAAYQAEREAEIAAIEVESTPNILDTDNEGDHAAIVKIMAEVAPVTFSSAPVKAPQSAPKPRTVATAPAATYTLKDETTEDLIEGFQRMRAERHLTVGIKHAKLTVKLVAIKAELNGRKVNTKEL